MKTRFILLAAAILSLCSCGTVATLADAGNQKYQDAIYYRPQTNAPVIEITQKTATDELISKTKDSRIFVKTVGQVDTLVIPQNMAAKFTVNKDETTTISLYDTSWMDNYWDWNWNWRFHMMSPFYYGPSYAWYRPYSLYGPFGFYGPYGYYGLSAAYMFSPFWYDYAFNPWFYDPWYYDPWMYDPFWYGSPYFAYGMHTHYFIGGRPHFHDDHHTVGQHPDASASSLRRGGVARTVAGTRGAGTAASTAGRGSASGVRSASVATRSVAARPAASGSASASRPVSSATRVAGSATSTGAAVRQGSASSSASSQSATRAAAANYRRSPVNNAAGSSSYTNRSTTSTNYNATRSTSTYTGGATAGRSVSSGMSSGMSSGASAARSAGSMGGGAVRSAGSAGGRR